MEKPDKNQFNERIRERTMDMAANIRNLLISKRINYIDRSFVSQLTRSASSVAANYRSATRGRSDAEFYSKICIVVEEVDETKFWLEFLIKIKILTRDETKDLFDETQQLVKLFSAIKKTMKKKLEEN